MKGNGKEVLEMDGEFRPGQMELNMKVNAAFIKLVLQTFLSFPKNYQALTFILGEWRNNKAHGKGKFWHVDGDIFEGQWADDKANGYGIYNHAHGAKYEGQWKDDLQDGYGIETWPDGSKYEGFYKQGKKHGQGSGFIMSLILNYLSRNIHMG